jgi:hypothetical protein
MKMTVVWDVASWQIALIMEAESTSETSVNFYENTRRNIPEDSHLNIFPCTQEPNEPYPDADGSSPHSTLKIHFNIIPPSTPKSNGAPQMRIAALFDSRRYRLKDNCKTELNYI